MKNLRCIFYATALCLILASTANAQVRRGSLYTGSSFSFNHEMKPYKSTSIGIYPDLGVFVTKRLATGGEIFFSSYSANDGSYKDFSFGGLYSLRYYLATNKFCPYAFFKVGGYYTSTKSGTSKATGYSTNHFEPGIGVDYFLNEHIAVECNAGYAFGKDNQSGVLHDHGDVNLTAGLQFFFALPEKK